MVPARVVLYIMSFSGFLVSFMMRMDINIAMVEMVKIQKPNPSDMKNNTEVYCYTNDANIEHNESLPHVSKADF